MKAAPHVGHADYQPDTCPCANFDHRHRRRARGTGTPASRLHLPLAPPERRWLQATASAQASNALRATTACDPCAKRQAPPLAPEGNLDEPRTLTGDFSLRTMQSGQARRSRIQAGLGCQAQACRTASRARGMLTLLLYVQGQREAPLVTTPRGQQFSQSSIAGFVQYAVGWLHPRSGMLQHRCNAHGGKSQVATPAP
jgi:hypothetical protein